MDLARFSKDSYKAMLSELVKNEDFVTEVNVTKSIRGGRLPQRVYTVIVVDPDAVTLEELKKMKVESAQAVKDGGGVGTTPPNPIEVKSK